MKPTRRLTDVLTMKKILLISLPAVPVAIFFIAYLLTLRPFSVKRMAACTALVECKSHYELLADGKPVACFKTLGDSLAPECLSLNTDSTVTTCTYTTAIWVNRWPLLPSCAGLMLTANGDSTVEKRLVLANKTMPDIIRKAIGNTTESISQLGRMQEEADYYMAIHNVNDDGYNVMAEFDENLKERREKAERLLAALEGAAKGKRLAMRLVTEYTLIRRDTAGHTVRTACRLMTADRTKPLRLLQTADRQMPDGASAVHLNVWPMPGFETGDSLVIASYAGCNAYGYSPTAAKTQAFKGAARGNGQHDVPPMLAPDGSPVFTERGRFAGISIHGRIEKAADAGFGLKHLMP